MSTIKISVIIPVYNGIKYIDRLMGCLKRQTFNSFEVIFVDDGSTDGSGERLDREAQAPKTFPITVFHQANAGQSSARNRGIRAACGDYIYFADIDDEITDDALGHLYLAGCESGCDFVLGNTSWIDGYGSEFLIMDPDSADEVIQGKENVIRLISDYADDPKSFRWFWTVWNKLYKTSLMRTNGIFFNEGMRSIEDIPYVVYYLSNCTSICITKKVLYRYHHYGQENYASAWQKQQPMAWKHEAQAFEHALEGRGFDNILAFNYCEFAIMAIFRLCLLAEITDTKNGELESAICEIVSDQQLQEKIPLYVQKHDDNDRRIPGMIMNKDVDGIIKALRDQIRKRKK